MYQIDDGTGVADRPLRVAALAKQVPLAESLELEASGRLRRDRVELEMNPYCRRAVAKAVELARLSGGISVVFTLGPLTAEDVLREVLAWGADCGVHLCDPTFAGSDTLATARALAAALKREGPFDLVLVGRNTADGDTGQVGPEIAQLLDLPFAEGARQIQLVGAVLSLGLELEDGWDEVKVCLPAVVSVAERLCEPCKAEPEARRAVSSQRLQRLSAADVGEGTWGEAGSPTRVVAVRVLPHERQGIVLSGDISVQVSEAARILEERGALTPGWLPPEGAVGRPVTERSELRPTAALSCGTGGSLPIVGVILEPGRPQVNGELIGAATRLAHEIGGEVVAFRPGQNADWAGNGGADGASYRPASGTSSEVGTFGISHVVELVSEGDVSAGPEDFASALTGWAQGSHPWAMLGPSTAFGREVASRMAAALGAGLVGDAIGIGVVDGDLVAAKPAFSGALVADIVYTSEVRFVTIRPGVLPVTERRGYAAQKVQIPVRPRGRVRTCLSRRDDDLEVLARAEVVVGVGTGVPPEEYAVLSSIVGLLGAEMAATRKVTDRGWMPRSRQVGVTGRSITPRLYLAIGLSGKYNHMVGVRGAGTVLAINQDPSAPVFTHADVGITGDWHEVLPTLEDNLRVRGARATVPTAGISVIPGARTSGYGRRGYSRH